MRAPVRRVTSADVPTPASYPLEQAFVPQAQQVIDAVKGLLIPQPQASLVA